MCNEFKGFADLENWEEESGNAGKSVSQFSEDIGDVAVPGFVEDCPKCRGTGNWRPGYPCFKCKGKGKLQFKTSPDARGKARRYATKSKADKQAEKIVAGKAWLDARPAIRDWMKADTSSFSASLLGACLKYGSLTERQEAAALNAVAKAADAEVGFSEWCEAYPGVLEWLTSETESGNEFAGSLLGAGKRFGSLTSGQLNAVQRNIDEGKSTASAASGLDISGLKGYFAVPDGDTRLKLCVRKPGKNSRYHGWTFVDDGAAYGSRRTYGKQAPDGTYSGSVQDALAVILKDPLAAQVAYGKLTGTCGHCGRILEDEASVAAGIGPICAAKY